MHNNTIEVVLQHLQVGGSRVEAGQKSGVEVEEEWKIGAEMSGCGSGIVD